LAVFNGATVDNYATGVTITKSAEKYKIAQPQKHNSYENRKEVVRETTLKSFIAAPDVIPAWRKELEDAYYANSREDFRANATL
jgi:hypothetical protein